MAVFFYNVRDGGTLIRDPEGQEMRDFPAMAAEAHLAAHELALQLLASGIALDEDVVLEVSDHTEVVVLTILLVDALKRPAVH